MNKHLIVIGTAVLLLVVGLSGCTTPSNTNNDGGNNYPSKPTPKPNIQVTSSSYRTGYEGVDYCFYVDIVVKNYGDGGGSSYAWTEVKQSNPIIYL